MRYNRKKTNQNKDKIGIRKLSAILIAALACLCWFFALAQLISSLVSPIKSIPAFLSLQANTAGKNIDIQKEGDTQIAIPAFRPSCQQISQKQQGITLVMPQAAEYVAQNHNKIPAASQLSTNTVFSSPEEVLSYLQSYDKDIRLVSSHQENNYLDLYFYSPLLQKSSKSNSSFNLQVAVTKNHTYFGTPFINYDF